MRKNFGLWLVALAFSSFLTILAPHQAYAGSTAASNLDCSAGNAIDTAQANNRQSWQQTLTTYATTLNSLFPVAPALSACQKQIMTAMQLLNGLADPLKIAQAIINPIIMGIVNQACSQVMGVITEAKQALTNLTKICLPIPQFKLGQLPSFSAPTCSGGMAVNLITSSGGNRPSAFNPSQYFSH